MEFDKLNTRDREFANFRQHIGGSICRAVHVDNPASDPIPVTIVSESVSSRIIKSVFNTVLGVASGSEVLINSYTVPPTKSAKLLRIEFGGTNISTYNLYINGNIEGLIRTWFNGSGLTSRFEFSGGTADGFPLIDGDIVEIKTIHARPNSGDFEARIQVVEIQE